MLFGGGPQRRRLGHDDTSAEPARLSVVGGTISGMTAIDERLVLETAAEHGVPGPVAQELMAKARPCLFLVPYEQVPPALREKARPVARTGGLPALPDGTEWPEGRDPLVLSVDCAALPGDVLDIELPLDGSLLFFSQIEYPPDSSVVLHVPAGVPTTERAASDEYDGEVMDITVYEPHTLYAVAGLTFGEDRWEGPAAGAFLDDADEETLDGFAEGVLDLAAGGSQPGVTVQLGGFSNSWDMAPDEGDLVLFAQIAGQAIDYSVYTMTLIVGTRADITARKYGNLVYEQQC